jgi:hypothetical protein
MQLLIRIIVFLIINLYNLESVVPAGRESNKMFSEVHKVGISLNRLCYIVCKFLRERCGRKNPGKTATAQQSFLRINRRQQLEDDDS